MTPKSKFWDLLKAIAVKYWTDRNRDLASEMRRRETQLESLAERRRRIFEMREDGTYSKDEFIERRKAIDTEIETVRGVLETEPTPDLDPVKSIDYAAEFFSTLGRQWHELLHQFSQRFQRLVFPEGVPYDRDLGFRTTRFCFIFGLNKAFLASKSQKVDLRGLSWNQLQAELQLVQGFYKPEPSVMEAA